MAIDPRSTERTTPENTARIVNLAGVLQRERAARGVAAWSDVPLRPTETSDRTIEQIVAVLADLSERMIAVERLADYAAEKAEAA